MDNMGSIHVQKFRCCGLSNAVVAKVDLGSNCGLKI